MPHFVTLPIHSLSSCILKSALPKIPHVSRTPTINKLLLYHLSSPLCQILSCNPIPTLGSYNPRPNIILYIRGKLPTIPSPILLTRTLEYTPKHCYRFDNPWKYPTCPCPGPYLLLKDRHLECCGYFESGRFHERYPRGPTYSPSSISPRTTIRAKSIGQKEEPRKPPYDQHLLG